MADHGTVEYATATGNDYPAHVGTYERFILFTFVGIIHVINLLLGLTVGGVMGHWFLALPIFIIAIIGGVSGLLSGSKTSSYVAFAIWFDVRRQPNSPSTRRARWSSPSWILTATRPRSRRWPMPGSLPLPWN
jgi:hypothetical protein